MDGKKIALVAVMIFLASLIPVLAANYNLKVNTYDKVSGQPLATDITVLDSAGLPVCSGTAVTTLNCNLPKAQYTIQTYNTEYNPMIDTLTLRADQTRHLFLILDTVKPSSSLQVSGTVGDQIAGVNWYTDTVTIDLVCSDSGSGCAKIVADLDGVVTADGAPPIALSFNVLQNGLHTLKYYSEDAAGNREAERTFVFGVDTTLPVLNAAGVGWTNVAQQFAPQCADPETGCETFFGYVSSTPIAQCPATSDDYTVALPAAVSQHEWWCAGAANGAGLFSSTPQPFEFKVDLVPPVVTPRVVPDGGVYSPAQVYWFNATVLENEALQTVEFDLDGQRFLPVKDNGEDGIDFAALSAGVHSYRWHAVDVAGNDHVFVNDLIIEKAPTEISLTTDWIAGNRELDTGSEPIVEAVLNVSGTVTLSSTYPGFSATGPSPLSAYLLIEVSGVYTVTAEFAGDSNYLPSTASVEITVLSRPDTESPVITVSNPADGTVQSKKVSLDFTVSDLNPFTTELSVDGGTFQPVTSGTILTLAENSVHTLILRATDLLDNVGEVLIQFTIPVLSDIQNSVVDGVSYAGDALNLVSGPSLITRTNITNSTITNSNLTDSSVLRSTLESTNLTSSTVTDATLKNSVLVRSTFIGKEAEFVEAEDSFLDPGNFTGSKFKSCTIVNSNVTYSNVADCSITNSNVNGSVIVGSTFNLSYVFNNSDVHGLSGSGVNITSDELVSGTVTYKGKEFTGPAKLSDIYSYVPPQPPTQPQGPSGGGGGGGGGGGFVPNYTVSLSSSESSLDLKEGDVKSVLFEVGNTGNLRLTGITLTLTEIPRGWYSFESYPAVLEPGSKANISIVFAPSGQSAEKTGKLLVNSSEGAVSEIPVSIKFTGSASPTTTTTIPEIKVNATLPGTTTTTTGPNPLTGLFTAIGGNPAAVAGVGIVLVVIGSIGWSLRSDSAKKKRAVIAEAEETEQTEQEGNNN